MLMVRSQDHLPSPPSPTSLTFAPLLVPTLLHGPLSLAQRPTTFTGHKSALAQPSPPVPNSASLAIAMLRPLSIPISTQTSRYVLLSYRIHSLAQVFNLSQSPIPVAMAA